MTKVELVDDRLKQLKGIPLLDKDGLIYLLKGHKLEDTIMKNWLLRPKKVEYISQIELSTSVIDLFEPNQFDRVLLRTNHIIADRKRYLHMLSCLSKLNYTIKKK